MHCIFCHEIQTDQVLIETTNFKVVFDIDPIQSGHLLVISKEHFMDVRELSNELLIELFELNKVIIDQYEASLPIDGVTVIQNNGAILDKGTHFHVHIVPRYIEDKFWVQPQVIEHSLDKNQIHNLLKKIQVMR